MMSADDGDRHPLIAAQKTLAVAESLTGGMLSDRIVEIPGISAVYRGGVVSYTNEVKASVLGVSRELLDERGPVDGEVACQMAEGVRRLLGADLAVATTGVAGPGPADGHEAGTVWIAVSAEGVREAEEFHFDGDRVAVRRQATQEALRKLTESAEG